MDKIVQFITEERQYHNYNTANITSAEVDLEQESGVTQNTQTFLQ